MILIPSEIANLARFCRLFFLGQLAFIQVTAKCWIFPAKATIGILFALLMKLNLLRTNLSLRSATEFATEAHVWRTVGSRLHLGQPHKSLFDKHKSFVHNSLQTAASDQISVAYLGGIALVVRSPHSVEFGRFRESLIFGSIVGLLSIPHNSNSVGLETRPFSDNSFNIVC